MKYLEYPIYHLSGENLIQIAQLATVNLKNLNTIHRNNFYELLLIRKGGLQQIIDFEEITAQDNSCYIVKPGQIHQYLDKEPDYGLLLCFKEKILLPDVIKQSLSIIDLHLHQPIIFENNEILFQKATSIINSMEDLCDDNSENVVTYKHLRLTHQLSDLLYFLESNITGSSSYINTDILIHFKQLTEQYFTKIPISEYANKLNTTPTKLARLTKKHLGISPLKYIHQRILIMIKRELIYGSKSHKEIAYDFGFNSPSHFSYFIKAHTGMSPNALQKNLRSIIKK